ncbi:MAG: AgmX/PglI C-terminal domain-containing protein [Pseudomonadales bacterium]
MSAAYVYHANAFALPWALGREDSRQLKRWLAVCLLMVGVVGVVVPFVTLPEIPREEQEALPPQLARIIMDKPKPVVPPPPPKPEEVAKEEPKPEPEKIPEPEPVKEVKPEPKPTVADAREKAASAGLLAFKDAFADMRDAVDVAKLQDTAAIQRGAGEAATIDRSVLTSRHSARSSGVNVAALSRDTGGVALSGRETTKVEVPEGQEGAGGVRERRAVDPRSRSIEEIRRIFDANKGAIFAIYNRALRADPTLRGKVVLELVIAPSGSVTDVRIVASELADEDVVAKILSRIRLFDFGKRDVGVTTISYPVHFLPT